ncbi:MAG TPA: GNAT family N-acetyltransferase [Spirochaetota bacterium]|nr:GNAT family N-acetyltransferase [Spirochaetota bacterium]
MIEIKEYSGENTDEIFDMILDIQVNEFNISISRENQPDLQSISEFYQNGNGNFWLAEDSSVIVGTVALKDIGGNYAALRKMFVRKEYRGKEKNISMLLLESVFRWGREKKIRKIFLGTTDKFLAAHRFYGKNGFIEINSSELPENFPLMKVDSKFYVYEF